MCRLWLLNKEIQDGTLFPNVYKSFTLPTELDRNYERGGLFDLTDSQARREKWPLTDRLARTRHFGQQSYSRPSEPKFTVIKTQKKLRTITAGGRVCVFAFTQRLPVHSFASWASSSSSKLKLVWFITLAWPGVEILLATASDKLRLAGEMWLFSPLLNKIYFTQGKNRLRTPRATKASGYLCLQSMNNREIYSLVHKE